VGSGKESREFYTTAVGMCCVHNYQCTVLLKDKIVILNVFDDI